MSVAVLIQNENESLPLMHWAAQIAVGWQQPVLALQLGERGRAVELCELVPEEPHSKLSASIFEAAEQLRELWGEKLVELHSKVIHGPDPLATLDTALEAAETEIMLVGPSTKDALAEQLFAKLHCAVLRVRPGAESPPGLCKQVLVPTVDSPHAVTALNVAAAAVSATDGWVDALFVEPPVGPDAKLVGERILAKVVGRVDASLRPRIRQKVWVADDVQEGIAAALSQEHGLLMFGSDFEPTVKRMLFRKGATELTTASKEITVGVVRQAMPITARVLRVVERILRRRIPQMGRADRVALVAQVQSNSQWDVDFIALICLSTLIAALGLLQDSSAVVIGAMLLAPLMTPLIGAGLALVQGNVTLLEASARSVVFGFLLAFGLGWMTGLLVPGTEPTAELLARGSPNLLDLLVALVSGIAAAYATSRPNLSSALPGVAIAAALVPPIATSGIALADGDFSMCAGAAVLFFTNIVAIVLGAAVALYGVGIRGRHAHGRLGPWVQRVFWALVVAVCVLSLPLSYGLYQSRFGERAPPAVVDVVARAVDEESDLQLRSVERSGGALSSVWLVKVSVVGPQPPREGLATEMAVKLTDVLGRTITVELSSHIQQRGAPPGR